MIEKINPNIKALILDMDGVLWRGDHPIGNLPSVFDKISSMGLKVILATNNSTKSAWQIQKRLQQFGVLVETTQIVNSSMAVAYLLLDRFPKGGPLYIIGEAGLLETLKERGFYPAEDNVLAVVAGMDRHVTYDKFKTATLLIRKGAPFYGTNDDKTFPTPEGLTPGAGALLAVLQTATDIQPIVAGKPFPAMFNTALKLLGLFANQVLVVGDRLETDIMGGINVGCPTALVLSGVTNLEQLHNSSIKPTFIAQDLASLLEA